MVVANGFRPVITPPEGDHETQSSRRTFAGVKREQSFRQSKQLTDLIFENILDHSVILSFRVAFKSVEHGKVTSWSIYRYRR